MNRSPKPQSHDAVMVSSTYTDLQTLRQVLMDAAWAAKLFPEAMEHDAALPGLDVIDSSLAKVERAAGYALLIGHRYGQQPVSADRNPDQRSITELEFDRAVELGRPTLLFVLGDDYPIAPRHVDKETEAVRRLAAFRERAKSKDGSGKGVQRVYAVVNSAEDLRVAAERSMRELAAFLARGDDEPELEPPPPPPPGADSAPAAPPARYAVPAYIGSHAFVGRRAELDLLGDWSAAEDAHPVLLFDAIGGSGKSMLTWHWFETQAPQRRDWAGRFWYSFYEAGASMAACCRHALAYMLHRPLAEFQKLQPSELTRRLLAELQGRPWLLVLDGLERVLVAYHRHDAATIADEALDQPSDEIADRNPCAAARTEDDELLRQLSNARPSKLLVSSRLMPQALLNPANQPIPGVRREALRGLRPEDAVVLLQQGGVRGDAAAMQRFVQAHCDGHPLVVGALAGLIVEPLPADGDFDAWVEHPDGGEALDLGQLDLVQKRNHILRAAIAAAPAKARELLATLALVHGGVDREALGALNPHRPPEPAEVLEPDEPEDDWDWQYITEADRAKRRVLHLQRQAEHAAQLRAFVAWRQSPELKAAPARLNDTLRDLQRRGLLQRGEGQEPHFDLHPVVRGIVSSALGGDETLRLGQRVVDHFSQRAHSPYEQTETLQDLEGGFHIVRTLLRMERHEQALDAWRGHLSEAVTFNVAAHSELLALLKPFFPSGWLQPPQGVDDEGSSYLMNDVACSLDAIRQHQQAIQVFGAMLRLDAGRRSLRDVRLALSNLSNALNAANRIADALDCIETALRVAQASDDVQALFMARLGLFDILSTLGNWTRAESVWADLDAMGRDWSRALYRQGNAEFQRAVNLWRRGESPAEAIAAAEDLTRKAKAPGELCLLLQLRGEWRLAEGAAPAAVAAFDELVRVMRAIGQGDVFADAWLSLARVKADEAIDARASAERLEASGCWGYALARLWQAAGDTTNATEHALHHLHWAWADGEPYVRRFELERARRLLAELGKPEPPLPPYDPTTRVRFEWQDEVEAAIAAIKQENREKKLKEPRQKK